MRLIHAAYAIVLFFVGYSSAQYIPLIIIGGGVAGYSAAIYGGNARISTCLCIGPRPGGQLSTAGMVENMPGVNAQYGIDIIERLEKQAESFGALIKHDTTIVSIVVNDEGAYRFTLCDDKGVIYYADALIIATGARPKLLHVPGESDFFGRGVSTCAICDCFLARDKDVIVVGGGDAAVEEALQLAPYAKSITIIVRARSLKASPRMQQKLSIYTHISYRYETEVKAIMGENDHIFAVELYNKATQISEIIPTQGVFLAIGQTPETDFLASVIPCNQWGYVLLKERQKTYVEGIFAAGDVSDGRYRQAIIAAGDGAKAALDAIEYLRTKS